MAFQKTNRKQSIGRILLRIFPVVYFVCLLLVGVVLHNNYGGFTDEMLEINTAAINIKYIFSKIPGLDRTESLRLPVYGEFATLQNLLEYEDRIYGTTALIPSLLVNLIPGVDLDLSGFLNFRRFYNFLTFWLALLCFYLTLRKRFENPLTAIFGVLVMTLTPRFFAESFYNSKDLIFFSWFLIALCCCAWYSVARSRHAIGLFFFAFALASNMRFYGIGLLPAFLVLITWVETKAGAHILTTIRLLALTTIGSLLTYYLATPLLWEMNWGAIREGLIVVHDTMIKTGQLYFGELVQTPDHYGYIAVWIGLTIPVLYLNFFAGQIVHMVVSLFRERSFARLSNERVFDWMVFGLIVVYYLLIVGMKTWLYNGWRHVYFLYAPMLMLIVAGFDCLINRLNRVSWRVVVVSVCGVYFALIAVWIIRNQRLDFVYFNEIGKTMASDFSRDYWGVGSRPCVMYLANSVGSERILLAANYYDSPWGATELTVLALPPVLRDRFDIIWKAEKAQYVCFSYANTLGNDHEIPGFRLMKTFEVDGYAVVGAYERVNWE